MLIFFSAIGHTVTASNIQRAEQLCPRNRIMEVPRSYSFVKEKKLRNFITTAHRDPLDVNF